MPQEIHGDKGARRVVLCADDQAPMHARIVGTKPGSIVSALTAALSLALSACGFHPLYGNVGTSGNIGAMLSGIYVEPIPDRVGYELRNDLLDLFNATGAADGNPYRLKLSLSEEEEAVILQPNTAITRYNYTLTAHYDLVRRAETMPVKSGDVSALTAYNVASAPFLFGTVTAERDAKDRAANEIADRIRTQLAVYFRQAALASANPSP
jgi:LPS-assembly lipoprotein